MQMADTLAVRVRRKERITEDVALFELVAADGDRMPAFAAGAHIDVHIPGGAIRQYSLCNAPGDSSHYEIAVLREEFGRGGSLAMHADVRGGDQLIISRPRNMFPLSGDAERSLLIAGGIGITPLLSMAEHLETSRQPFDLHYCSRSRARTAFADALASSRYGGRVHFHFDDGPPEQRLRLGELLAQPPTGLHLYCCGPKGFMDAVLGTARSCGWTEAQLHHEVFNARSTGPAADEAFEIQLASSGRIIPVGARQTALAALEAHGICIPRSCEQGVCGTCLTAVVDGIPDHRDVYLTTEEQAANRQFLPCCSRAKTFRIVIDL